MAIEPSTTNAALPAASQAPCSERLLSAVVDRTVQRPARADGIVSGIVEAIDAEGTPLVSVPVWGLHRIRASSIVQLDSDRLGQHVALGFNAGDPLSPIVLGVMLEPSCRPAPVVVLDGERVVLEAAREVELRCGEAALILSADGRIQLRGTYITSHASATQRILGGAVNVN